MLCSITISVTLEQNLLEHTVLIIFSFISLTYTDSQAKTLSKSKACSGFFPVALTEFILSLE